MTSARDDGARKRMRAIPLTQRQRKQGKSVSKPLRAQSASPRGTSAHGPRGERPVLISPAPPAKPGSRPAAPLDLNAESGVSFAPATPKAPAKPAKKKLDTAERSAPPAVEIRPMVMTPTSKTETDALPDAPLDAAQPPRVRVRVRRKRPTPTPLDVASQPVVELAETTTLPDMRVAPPVAQPGATLDDETALLTPDAADAVIHSTKEEAAPPVDIPGADASAPRADETAARMASVEEGAAEDAVAETEALPPEPRQPAITRKLPTLAVMAALATRAEARAESGVLGELSAPEARETPEAPASQPEASDSPAPGAVEMDGEGAQAPEVPISAPSPDPGTARATQPRAPRVAPTSQPPAAAPDAPSSSGRRRMWWLNQPQAGHEARDGGDGGERRDALDGRAGSANGHIARPARPEEVARAPIAPPSTSSPTQPRRRLAAPPVALPPAPRISRSIPRQPDHWREAARGASRPRRAEPSGRRVRAPAIEEDGLARLLVWVGGAQAALCGAAALVAALALLNGTAGSRAQTVFGWAMAFALIAGAGAGLGHLAWQMKRARLAPVALVLSQLCLLFWALALLGARPALIALAPFTLALALRGLGRGAAALTALATLALYALTLALTMSGWLVPTVQLDSTPMAWLDTILIVAGMALTALALVSLYAAGEREQARTRAIERAARLAALELDSLRGQTEDDADALRRALAAALRGVPTEGVRAEGALSPLAEQVSVMAERLVELSHDREERKRLEAAARRLIRNIERAWLGLSWSWPEASGVILDDLVALLRTPPPGEPSRLPEGAPTTGQLVAPHLYRAWQPSDSSPSQPLSPQPSLWPDRAAPSQPSGIWPSLWPSDPEPGVRGADPLALPPSPRWRGPDDEPRAPNSAGGIPWPGGSPGGSNGSWRPDASRPAW